MIKKVVFFDVDGTLLEYIKGMTSPLQSTIDAIKKLKDNGHVVVIATGRPRPFLPKEILSMDFHGYITANGAVVERDKALIYSKKIEKGILKKAVELFKKEKIVYFLEGYQKAYFSSLESQEARDFYEVFGVPRENITDEWKLEDIEANKMVVTIRDKDTLQRCVEILGNDFIFMKHPGAYSYDVYFKDCSKADGIREFLNYTGLDMKDTYAFGDGQNDIEMIQTVGTGVAMGNAKEELKSHADYVTDDVFSHGIANALKHFKLI
ncbi:Cof-type HAD-IIB family hydrolase [Alkalicella caledoniensis]|uniref:Cof-type HAD-IIB family hydrolase n=1 Tax=Alkalicella caledoniensis TaxID=2731377 RepID=A0A7G9WAU7_ALKCA|nr:Cof-type HAD-IIB family hydrolase [Alkalicella caledoniensis]QNO15809.1 Cof-type HAD-IIB family hydrolase [Alkalicella caledoniensis]